MERKVLMSVRKGGFAVQTSVLSPKEVSVLLSAPVLVRREGGMCKTAVRRFHSSCEWDAHTATEPVWIQLTSIPWFKPLWWCKTYTTLGVISTPFRHLAYRRHFFSLRSIALLSCPLYGEPTLPRREVATAQDALCKLLSKLPASQRSAEELPGSCEREQDCPKGAAGSEPRKSCAAA